MLKVSRAGIVLLVVGLAGCGGGVPTTNNSPPPPHGGRLIPLRDDQGFVEVVKKQAASKTASVTAEFSFYFLKDSATPITPAPTTGTLVTADGTTITLGSDGGALVTPAGTPLFGGNDPEGVLKAEVGGKTISVPLNVR